MCIRDTVWNPWAYSIYLFVLITIVSRKGRHALFSYVHCIPYARM